MRLTCYIHIFLTEWNLETNGCLMNMETVEPLVLANSLGRFYCEARPQPKKPESPECTEKPTLYHKNILINFRAAINQHLEDLRRYIDSVHVKAENFSRWPYESTEKRMYML